MRNSKRLMIKTFTKYGVTAFIFGAAFSLHTAFAADLAPGVPHIISVDGIADGACHDGHDGPVLNLRFSNMKKREGQMRIELYGDQPELFLEGNGRIYKYFAPVPAKENDIICVAVPQLGDYGLLVIHDMNNDRSPDFFSDGFGLSTNPKLQLRRPRLDEALFSVTKQEMDMDINLQYVTGSGQTKKRGARRR